MWCMNCHIETNEKVCPVCNNKTIEEKKTVKNKKRLTCVYGNQSVLCVFCWNQISGIAGEIFVKCGSRMD